MMSQSVISRYRIKFRFIVNRENCYLSNKMCIRDRCYIMQNGAIKLSGDSTELMGNEEVNKSYLGG